MNHYVCLSIDFSVGRYVGRFVGRSVYVGQSVCWSISVEKMSENISSCLPFALFPYASGYMQGADFKNKQTTKQFYLDQ